MINTEPNVAWPEICQVKTSIKPIRCRYKNKVAGKWGDRGPKRNENILFKK
jgi:hypothetical protein